MGLYIFGMGNNNQDLEMTEQLLKIWKEAKVRRYNDFEIVLVNDVTWNRLFAEEEFKKKFGCAIPWYSLPVDGRKVSAIFKIGWHHFAELVAPMSNAGYFIMLQPDKYQPLSYFAYDILEEYGIDAYPFTLERAVMTETLKQQEKLVLTEILSPMAPLCRGGSRLKVCSLFMISLLV